MTEEERKLRTEFNTPSFKQTLKESKGTECVNCGSGENVQYHHIVPICVGGTNNMANIVPLCERCHLAVHNFKDVKEFRTRTADNIGRKTMANTPQGKKAIDDFIMCRIGTKEFKSVMKYGANTKAQDCAAVKVRMQELGILKMRNAVDYYNYIENGDIIGRHFMADGTVIEIKK